MFFKLPGVRVSKRLKDIDFYYDSCRIASKIKQTTAIIFPCVQQSHTSRLCCSFGLLTAPERMPDIARPFPESSHCRASDLKDQVNGFNFRKRLSPPDLLRIYRGRYAKVVALTPRGGHGGWFCGFKGLSWVNEAPTDGLAMLWGSEQEGTEEDGEGWSIWRESLGIVG